MSVNKLALIHKKTPHFSGVFYCCKVDYESDLILFP